jgi:hypothetical protein
MISSRSNELDLCKHNYDLRNPSYELSRGNKIGVIWNAVEGIFSCIQTLLGSATNFVECKFNFLPLNLSI